MTTKKIAYLGLFIALAFVFSYIEFLIPIHIGIPGVKLGLGNLVTMVVMYTLGNGYGFGLSIVRVILTGFTFGNLASMLYSLGGAILSYVVMLFARKTKLLSVTGVSVLGGVFHNIGQLMIAMLVLETSGLIYYFPVLLVSGVVSGAVIGVLGGIITKRIQKIVGNGKE